MKSGLKIMFASIGLMTVMCGCGKSKNERAYDDLIKIVSDATIYSATATTAITAKGNMAFKDMTNAVTEDLEHAKEHYGIDLTLGMDGELDVLKVSTLVSDGKISYSNNFNTWNFTSSNEAVDVLINNYLETHTSRSEAYVDLFTGEAMVRVDDGDEWTEIGPESGMDNTLITNKELLPLINIVADTMGKENAIITPTNTGCSLEYDLALNYEILSRVPENYRDMLEEDGISYDNVLNVMKSIDKGDYAFPLHMKVNFLRQNDAYVIGDIALKGDMVLSFDKSFDELREMGLGADGEGMPEDYRFGTSGNIMVNIEYKNVFGYTPTEIFTEDNPMSQTEPIPVTPVKSNG